MENNIIEILEKMKEISTGLMENNIIEILEKMKEVEKERKEQQDKERQEFIKSPEYKEIMKKLEKKNENK